VDHAVRPGSADDARFVEGLAGGLGVPLLMDRLGALPSSSEAELRRARHAALEGMARDHGCDRIALGHTRDDQVETVLFRLLRGTSGEGAAGMAQAQGAIIRPLLDLPRADVEAYARDRGLEWREDPTNRDVRYTRNRLRHELLPGLRQAFPGLDAALARFASTLESEREQREAVRDTLRQALGFTRHSGENWTPASAGLTAERVTLDLSLLPPSLRAALPVLLPEMLARAGGDAARLRAGHFHAFAELASAPRGEPRQVRLPGLIVAARSGDVIVLEPAPR
jgi:tRNA(Ile)-lysidine synthase